MSTSVIEPGGLLAGRYRLEDRAREAGGSTLWKAVDEILARPVAVRTFAPGFLRVGEVVTAARAASRLTDPRLTQVFDADDSAERAYVVSEWVGGETLEDMLAVGPMEPERATALVGEAAEALVAAHASGLAHLCITPHSLSWTSGGTVKVTGLGVDAAQAGITSDDPGGIDAQGLGRMLYAALTGHWPGSAETVLPPAPVRDGLLCAPRQVHAGIPRSLDAIVCRALRIHLRPGQDPLADPGAVAEALAGQPRTPLPLVTAPYQAPHQALRPSQQSPAPRPAPPPVTMRQPAAPTGWPPAGVATAPGAPGELARSYPRHSGSRAHTRPLVALALLLAVVVVGVGGWQLSRIGQPDSPSAQPSATASTNPATTLRPVSAEGFDPPPDGDGEEHSSEAKNAIDGAPETTWTTEGYQSAELGGLKSGVGLLIDMGRVVAVSGVEITMPGAGGAELQLRLGDRPSLGSLPRVAGQRGGGSLTLRPDQPAKGRYVLLWFTELPQNGKYRGQIGEVVVRGTG